MKSVGLGNGQVFWFETRQGLESAIARLTAEQMALVRQEAEPMIEAMRRLATQSEPGVVDWPCSWVAIANANPGRDETYITNLTGRVWGALLRAQHKQRVPFGVYCSECGEYKQGADLSHTRIGMHGVRHATSCDVAKQYRKQFFKVRRESLLQNKGALEQRNIMGVGPAILRGFSAFIGAGH